MCSECEHCELLLMMEQEKTKWSKEIISQNINLHKKLNEQQELIIILKSNLLKKRSTFVSECMANAIQDISKLAEDNKNLQSGFPLERQIMKKLEEVSHFINIFNSERLILQKVMKDNEVFFSESVTYLNGLVDYFRDSLFNELDKSNRLGQYFTNKISRLATSSHYIVLDTLKEEGERLNNELKLRYQKTIQKSKEETERQSLLVSKLRKHNKQLYLQIQKTKTENEGKNIVLEKNIQDLKETVQRLKAKNNYLHTQLKLGVEGCQNDIYDARKRIRELKKHQS